MIKILYTNNKFVPILTCDICGKHIEEASNASVVFSLLKSGIFLSERDMTDVLIAHNGNCFLIAEQFLGGRNDTGTERLDLHLLYLLDNSKLNLEKLRELNLLDREFFSQI